jgi:hypothetical protein
MTPDERAKVAQVARQLWDGMDENQRTGVRFGLFPAEIMQAHQEIDGHELAVALMDVATANGGMRA